MYIHRSENKNENCKRNRNLITYIHIHIYVCNTYVYAQKYDNFCAEKA